MGGAWLMTDGYGPVEAATRAMVAELGRLSPRLEVQAQQAIRVAALLDAEEAGAQASALSRELRQLTSTLREVHPAAPAPGPEAAPPKSRLDQLAEKRAQRRADGAG
jgi:hypothetical protein